MRQSPARFLLLCTLTAALVVPAALAGYGRLNAAMFGVSPPFPGMLEGARFFLLVALFAAVAFLIPASLVFVLLRDRELRRRNRATALVLIVAVLASLAELVY